MIRCVVLSILSGVAWPLACPNVDWWVLAWVAGIPLLACAELARSGKQAFLWGLLTGTVANAGGFYWITGLLQRFGKLPFPIAVLLFLLLAAYQGITFGLFSFAVNRIRRRFSLPLTLIAPLSFCAFEFGMPYIFPFYLAITQAWNLRVIQVADLGGPLAVTALIFLGNGAIYDVARYRRRYLVAALSGFLILGLALGYGEFRIRQVTATRNNAKKIKVGLVQPNVSFDMKGIGNPEFRQQQLADLQLRSRELTEAGAELLVWTESSYPYWLARQQTRDFPEEDPRRIRRGFDVPLVMGAVTLDARNTDDYPYNSALMLNGDGQFTGRFDKIYLLIFGEYIPGLETFPWVRKLVPKAAGHFHRGKDVATFPFWTKDGQTFRLGPMICYEDIIPSFGRKLAKDSPHLLVNLTNDAWFGDTTEPWEHLALSVFRSVEMRTDLVRAVNTGVTAFVDATGQVTSRTYAVDPTRDPKPADKLLGEVALMEGGKTVYARIGDVFAVLMVVGCAALLFPALRRRGSTDP